MTPAAEDESTITLSPQRNVTFAVNYEVSHFFPPANQSLKLPVGSYVQSVPAPTDVNPIPGNIKPKPSATQTHQDPKISSLTAANTLDAKKVHLPKHPFPLNQATTNLDTEKRTVKLDTATASETSTNSSITTSSISVGNPKSVDFKMPESTDNTTRRSAREQKKRQSPVDRTRVRYDMELVPVIKRNRIFLDRFPLWMTPSPTREDKLTALQMQQQSIIKQHQQKLQVLLKQQQLLVEQQTTKQRPLMDQKQTGKPPKVAQPPEQQQQALTLLDAGSNSDAENAPLQSRGEVNSFCASYNENTSPELIDDQDITSPFAEDTSVIWVPKKRSDWEDSVLEMTAVCTSAAMRRYFSSGRKSTPKKPFQPPLSKEYIKDRVDIDDPLNGYQIRHRTGGWLQGFILWTNFTTWTHYFKWDSSHAMSGIPTMNNNTPALVDTDGSVAGKLESQPRSGDPLGGGVVCDGVAEISLVGGLGCGEYLLRMALDNIRAARKYKFVVLQATDSSKTFYERFGFVRVGAICRYERFDKDAGKPTAKPAGKPGTRPVTPIMGYRHWTHPNESDSSLQMHGGPSYMMCLTLPEDDPNLPIETLFLDEMMKLEVANKPMIDQLGGSSTPYPKARRGSVDSTCSINSTDAQLGKTGPRKRTSKGRRGSNGSPRTVTSASLRQTFDAKVPPVLPILGASMTVTPARNAPASVKSMGRKDTATSSGVKRGANTLDNPSAKKRRLGASAVVTDTDGASRKAPRDRSKTAPTPAKSGPGVKGKATVSSQTPKSTKTSSKRATPRRTPDQIASTGRKPASTPTPKQVPSPDPSKGGPTKQKVKSYPRDRVHFYNKVVRPKKGKRTENFFVLHYDEPKDTVRIIPMEAKGVLSGKRAGRPRFQVVMNGFPKTSKTVACADYDIVKAFMVMKTPVVASEAWDVLDA